MSSVSKIARKESPIVGFSEEDARLLHHPHDDALVVNIYVGDYNVHRVLVDNGSSADILYYPTGQNTIDTDEYSAGWLWGNKGISIRSGHTLGDSGQLSSANHEGLNIPCGRLLVRL